VLNVFRSMAIPLPLNDLAEMLLSSMLYRVQQDGMTMGVKPHSCGERTYFFMKWTRGRIEMGRVSLPRVRGR
jgi:hypothetical protein